MWVNDSLRYNYFVKNKEALRKEDGQLKSRNQMLKNQKLLDKIIGVSEAVLNPNHAFQNVQISNKKMQEGRKRYILQAGDRDALKRSRILNFSQKGMGQPGRKILGLNLCGKGKFSQVDPQRDIKFQFVYNYIQMSMEKLIYGFYDEQAQIFYEVDNIDEWQLLFIQKGMQMGSKAGTQGCGVSDNPIITESQEFNTDAGKVIKK